MDEPDDVMGKSVAFASPGAWSDRSGAVNRSTVSTSPTDSNSGRGSPADKVLHEKSSRVREAAASPQMAAAAAASAEGSFGSSSNDNAQDVSLSDVDDDEQQQRGAGFELAGASSLSPTRETFRDRSWSGEESEEMFDGSNGSGIGAGEEDNDGIGDNMRFDLAGAASVVGGAAAGDGFGSDSDDPDASFDLLAHLPGNPSGEPRAGPGNGEDGERGASAVRQEDGAGLPSSALPPALYTADQPLFSLGVAGPREADGSRSPCSLSGSRSHGRNTDRGVAQRAPSQGAGSPQRPKSPQVNPQRVIPTARTLRRSPRVAAAKAAVAARVEESPAARLNALESSLLRSAKKRSGPGVASSADGIATPYSTRRSRRASAAFRPFTPGAESAAGGDAGLDSSFRTAIMGEDSPADKSILDHRDDKSITRRGKLFEEESANKHNGTSVESNSLLDSEPTPTVPAALEAAHSPNQPGISSDGIADHGAGTTSADDVADDIASLETQMSSLTCGADGAAGGQVAKTAATDAAIGDTATGASVRKRAPEAFSGAGVDDDKRTESSRGAQTELDLSTPVTHKFAPPSPAVGMPSAVESSFSSQNQDCEVSPSPYTSQQGGGGLATSSTFGVSSYDHEDAEMMAVAFAGDESAIDLTLPVASSASMAVSRTLTKVEQTPLASSSQAGAGDLAGEDGGDIVAATDDAVREILGAADAAGPISSVEMEARAMASAAVAEEESRTRTAFSAEVGSSTSTSVPLAGSSTEAPINVSSVTRAYVNARHKTVEDRSQASIRSSGSTRTNGSLGSAKVNRISRPASPSRASMRNRPMATGSSKITSSTTATMTGVISTMSADHGPAKSGVVDRGRRMSVTTGPVVARRQSMAFGSPVPTTAAAMAIASGGAAVCGRASVAGRPSVGGGVGRVEAGKDGAASTAHATSLPTAAAVPAVAATSHLLVPTASSQSRARSRSASPAAAAARGRASSAGGGGAGPSICSGPMAGGHRRMSSEQALQPQSTQVQPPRCRPRSSSTGRRALTTPKTPNFRTSHRVKVKDMETTEEAEVRKQREMQQQVKEMTRRNQVAMERSRRTAYSGNVRSNKPLTVPESPAMQTVGRLGGKVYAAVGSQVYQTGFSPTHPAKDDPLTREHAALPSAGHPKGPTVPHPFHLSQSNRTIREPGSAGGVGARGDGLTFRETMTRIENKTPERYRTKPAGVQLKPTAIANAEPPKPTLPVSPRFRTEARAVVHPKPRVLSREEREEAELAEMKKHQFKARPFRADGFGVGGEKGVFRPQHSDKQLTQPAPFRLSTEGRAVNRAPSPLRSRDEEELLKQFKARPMPGGRSSSVGRVRPGANVCQGAPDLRARQCTVAASPMLSTKRRSAIRSSSIGGMQTSEEAELEEAAGKQFKARPMPDYSRLAGQVMSRRQSVAGDQSIALTEPRPFNLRSEERGKAKQALLAQRLEEKRRQEEAAQRVRARPLPPASMGFVPAPCERPLTETAEFSLSGMARHERAAQQFRERVRREEERARRATKVKALPLPPATFEPESYRPRTEIALTEPIEVVLHSTARAEGRAQWDVANQARLEAEERRRLEEAEAAAAAEKASIAEMRRKPQEEGGMSFKAKPIQWNSSPPECAQLSTAPLTTPITPNLRTKRRAINAINREQQAPLA